MTAADVQRQLYLHADALRDRARNHAPGDALIDGLMADHAERLADRIGMLEIGKQQPTNHEVCHNGGKPWAPAHTSRTE